MDAMHINPVKSLNKQTVIYAIISSIHTLRSLKVKMVAKSRCVENRENVSLALNCTYTRKYGAMKNFTFRFRFKDSLELFVNLINSVDNYKNYMNMNLYE